MAVQLGATRSLSDAVRVSASAPMELGFAMLHCKGRQSGSFEFPSPAWMDALPAGWQELASRLDAIWADFPAKETCEIMVLAVRNGTLWDPDMDRFFANFDDAASRPREPSLMPYEPPELRLAIQGRLELLRRDEARRTAYRALLHDCWQVVRPIWERHGLNAVEEACGRYRAALKSASDIRTVLPAWHFARLEQWAPLVDEGRAGGRLAIAPSYFAGAGQCIEDLPGTVVLGVGVEMERAVERRRNEAERAAGRFKVLSDPTRLTILVALMKQKLSVTDLALRFELSQPTVSVHVKGLREANLLESIRERNQTLYSTTPERIREFVAEALSEATGTRPRA